MFFGLGDTPVKTLDEIAREFDKTRERARVTKERSIRRLKQHSKAKNLKIHLF